MTTETVHALIPHYLGIACDRELLASTVATDHSPIPEGETDCMGMRVITCPDCLALALIRATANEAGVAIDDAAVHCPRHGGPSDRAGVGHKGRQRLLG